MGRSAKGVDLDVKERAALDAKLLRAVSEKKPVWLAELIQEGADPDAKYSNGVPAIAQAATDPCHETALALLAGGADASARSASGMTALMWAAIKDPSMIPMLVEPGDPDAAEREHGWTALMYACNKLSDARHFESLAKASGLEVRDKKGRTALMIAAERGAAVGSSLVRCLLDLGADAKARDQEGECALDKAARDGSSESATMLAPKSLDGAGEPERAKAREFAKKRGLASVAEAVERACGAPASPKAGPSAREAAQAMLVDACGSGSLQLAREAIRRGALADGAPGARGEPLICAAQLGDAEVVKLLLRAGADPKVERHAFTPLSLAAAYGSLDIVKLLLPLSDLGAASSRTGATALHEAAQASAAVLDELIRAGARVDAVDFAGRTPLAEAANRSGGAPMVELLLAAGAELAPEGFFGESVGEAAARRGSLDSVAMLAKAGAYDDEAAARPALAWAKLRAMPSMAEIVGARLRGASKGGVEASTGAAAPRAAPAELAPLDGAAARALALERDQARAEGSALSKSESNELAKALRRASSAMWKAAAKGDAGALGKALKEGADAREVAEDGSTPLTAACSAKAGEPGRCARMLAAAGAHPLARDAAGRSGLMLRAMAGDAEGVQALSAFGGAWARDASGDDALSLAARAGSAAAMAVLLAKGPKPEHLARAFAASLRAPAASAGACVQALLAAGLDAGAAALLEEALAAGSEPACLALAPASGLESDPSRAGAAMARALALGWADLAAALGAWAPKGAEAPALVESAASPRAEPAKPADFPAALAMARAELARSVFATVQGPAPLPVAKAMVEARGRVSPRELAALANELGLWGAASAWSEAHAPKRADLESMGPMLALGASGRWRDAAKSALALGKCVLVCGLGAKPWDGFAEANVNGALEAGTAFDRCSAGARGLARLGWPLTIQAPGRDETMGLADWAASLADSSAGEAASEELFEERFWEEASKAGSGSGRVPAAAALDMRELVARSIGERPSLPADYPLDLASVPGIAPELRSRLAKLAGRMRASRAGRGILLHGAPGVGKTMLARLLAKEGGRAWVHASLSEWAASDSLGPHLQAMRAAFERAIALAPSVMFLDELDSVGGRKLESTLRNQIYVTDVINALLDWVQRALEAGVWVVSASNHPEAVDPALTRAGRLGEWIEVPEPGQPEREAILAWAMPGLADPVKWARALSGSSPAALREAATEARMLAVERGADAAVDSDMSDALAAMRAKSLRGRDARALRWPMAVGLCAKARAIELGWAGEARVVLASMEIGSDAWGSVVHEGGSAKGSAKQAWTRLQIALAPAAARVAASRELAHGRAGEPSLEGLASLADLDAGDRLEAKALVEELARMGMGGRALAAKPWDAGSWFDPQKASASIMESAWEAAMSAADAGLDAILPCARDLMRDGEISGDRLRLAMGLGSKPAAAAPAPALASVEAGAEDPGGDARPSTALGSQGAGVESVPEASASPDPAEPGAGRLH